MNSKTYPRLRNLSSISFRNLKLSKVRNVSIRENNSTSSEVPLNSEASPAITTKDQESTSSVKSPSYEIGLDNKSGTLDSFYTIRIPSSKDDRLVYLSEICACNGNADFQDISIPKPPDIRLIIVELWLKDISETGWTFLKKFTVHLHELEYVGMSASIDNSCLKDNSIIFSFNGRVYLVADDINVPLANVRKLLEPQTATKPTTDSYSFDTIRSLSTLFKSVSDISLSKYQLSEKISEQLRTLDIEKSFFELAAAESQFSNKIESLDKDLKIMRSENEDLASRVMSLRVKLGNLRGVTKEQIPKKIDLKKNEIELTGDQCEPLLHDLKSNLYLLYTKRLCEISSILQEIIKIENIDHELQFSIMGLQFPPSMRDILSICYYNKVNSPALKSCIKLDEESSHKHNIQHINAALGYIALLSDFLFEITDISMPYFVCYSGSQSSIVDPIPNNIRHGLVNKRKVKSSVVDETNTLDVYPLYYDHSKSVKSYSGDLINGYNLCNSAFEMGITLLNRNVSTLVSGIVNNYNRMTSTSGTSSLYTIPNDCLDNLLWNLKFILLFISAPDSNKLLPTAHLS